MGNQLTAKESGRLLLLGGGVVILTPILYGFVQGVGFLATAIPLLGIPVGTALSAGVAAYVVEFAIKKFM